LYRKALRKPTSRVYSKTIPRTLYSFFFASVRFAGMVDAQREVISPDFASNGSQSNFAFVLGTFADPDHIAGQGVESVLIQDDLNHLTAPKTETAAYPEPMFRGVERKAREPLLLSVEIHD
jgi:hypothetical protein